MAGNESCKRSNRLYRTSELACLDLLTLAYILFNRLDIRDGDWVTIIHAYDDGWGLCERNGRRGVVPLEVT